MNYIDKITCSTSFSPRSTSLRYNSYHIYHSDKLQLESIEERPFFCFSNPRPTYVLDFPFVISNPNCTFRADFFKLEEEDEDFDRWVTYNDHDFIYKLPHDFYDYLDPPERSWCRRLYTDAPPFTSHCPVVISPLYQFSKQAQRPFFLQHFQCKLFDITEFEQHLISPTPYGIFSKFNNMFYDPPSSYDIPTYINAKFHGEDFPRDEDPFICQCVEPTSGSLFKGLGASVYSAYHLSTWNISESEVTNIMARWGIELIQLSLNFTPTNLILSFLKLLTHWFDITPIIEHTFNIFSSTFEFLSKKLSTQPSKEQVEATSLITDLASLANVKDSIPALTSALAALSVVFATIIVGKNVDSSMRSKSMSEKIAETMNCFSKFKSGTTAIISIIKDFSNFVYEVMFDLLGLESESHLVSLIRSVDVQDTDDFKKEKIFEYCKFLSDPSNLIIVQGNKFHRDQLNFCFNVLNSLRHNLANHQVSISALTNSYINNLYNEIKKLREVVSKSAMTELARFCPFWINLIGDSHTGKSTFTAILVQYLVKLLKEIEKKEGIDFELPTAEEELYYSVNFADKYETNYRQQYFTIIDDFAQDNGVPEINSALKLINWCSSVPYATNQAALADKGIPFTSKIIVSTSNDCSLENRTEIVDKDALTNRICVSYKFTKSKDPNGETYEWFARPIKIQKYNWKTKSLIPGLVTPMEIIQECAQLYLEWFKKEKKIGKMREIKPDLVKEMLNNIYSNEAVTCDSVPHANAHSSVASEVTQLRASIPCDVKQEEGETTPKQISGSNSSPTVEATSTSMWCWMKMTPRIVDGVYDCDCSMHDSWNRLYRLRLGDFGLDPEFRQDLSRHPETAMYENVHTFALQQQEYRDQVQTLERTMSNSWNSLKRKLLELMKHRLFQLVAGATVVLATSSYFMKFRGESEDAEDEIDLLETSKGYSTTGLRKRLPRKLRIKNHIDRVEATYGFKSITDMFSNDISVNAMEVVSNSIIRNGNVCLLKSDTIVNTGLRIEGTAILTNHHFLNRLKNGDRLRIEFCISDHPAQKFEQTFNRARMHRIGDTDLVVYNCDHSIPNCRSVIKHFPEDEMRSSLVKALVVTADPMPIVFTNIIAKPNTSKSTYTVEGVTYDNLDHYETNCPVQKGMSGSILFSLSKMDQHKIIGIQTCRNTNGLNENGYFKPISQGDLRAALAALNVSNFSLDIEKAIEATSLISDDRCPPNLQGGKLRYLGTVPKTHRIKQPSKTKIEPSVIHDALSLTQQPSVLHDLDERMDDDCYGKSVIYRSVEGFSHPIGVIDTAVLERAIDQLKIEYDVRLDVMGIRRRVLNLFETVNGIPDIMLPLNMKTSPGYPLVLERVNSTKGGKYEWFEETEIPAGYGKAYLPTPKLLSGLEQTEQQLLSGEMPLFVAYCCLKDETRPIAKIKAGKTRAFICLPLIFNLLVRKYFGAFTSAMKKRAIDISSCVGIDPAKDWGRLHAKLVEKNSRWEDFDYANWDQYLHPELVLRVADIVNYWYNDGSVNARVRSMLLYNLVHTIVIVKDKMFVKSQGQCSGCAITAELNCLVHDLLMTYVWEKIHQDQGLQTSLIEMRENVALCVYGDDIIMSVDPEYPLDFSGNSIAPYMSDLGMNITPGDKISTSFEKKDPKDIFFLKRNFVRDGEAIYAPLRSDIVENIIQWVHHSNSRDEATLENCKTALRESYMHRRSYFEELSKNINNRIKVANQFYGCKLQPVVMSFDAIEDSYYCGSYVCAGLDGPTLCSEA